MNRRQWLIRIGVGIAILLALPFVALAWLLARPGPAGAGDPSDVVERQIAALTLERDSLRTLVWEDANNSALLVERPNGDVVIGLPTPFVEGLVRASVAAWFDDVTVTLRGLRVVKKGDVRARLGILGVHRVGSFDLNLTLDEVIGQMKAGVPDLTFGGDRIGVTLPVRVTGGTVEATIAIAWKSRGLARQICKDKAVTRAITGDVRPSDHVATGRIVLGVRDGAILADPDFPALAIRLFAEPSETSLAMLDSILGAEYGACGYALDKANAGDKIVAVVDRGFVVKIPQKLFRPIRFPVGVETSVPLQDGVLPLEVRPTGLAVTRATVWFGADVRILPRDAARVPPP